MKAMCYVEQLVKAVGAFGNDQNNVPNTGEIHILKISNKESRQN
jgi:hypothetical protein